MEGSEQGRGIRAGPQSSMEPSPPAGGFVSVVPGHRSVRVHMEVARTMADADRRSLLSWRKLVLVLDIDQTMLHASVDSSLEAASRDRFPGRIEAVDLEGSGRYYVSLRPHIHEFLARMVEKYELYVYTKAQRGYAEEMCRLLDPSGRFFRHRLLTATEDARHHLKDIRQLFPCDDSLVAVLDDGDVWDTCKNVVKARPYEAFRAPRTSHAPAMVRPMIVEDDFLPHVADFFERVHEAYFQEWDGTSPNSVGSANAKPPLDIKRILYESRQKILAGVNFIFSGLFPVHVNVLKTSIVALAENFGACYQEEMVDSLTHVVAVSEDTDKVHMARARGLHVVSPGWLLHSMQYLTRLKESCYPVTLPCVAAHRSHPGAAADAWEALPGLTGERTVQVFELLAPHLTYVDAAYSRLACRAACVGLQARVRAFSPRGFARYHEAIFDHLYRTYVENLLTLVTPRATTLTGEELFSDLLALSGSGLLNMDEEEDEDEDEDEDEEEGGKGEGEIRTAVGAMAGGIGESGSTAFVHGEGGTRGAEIALESRRVRPRVADDLPAMERGKSRPEIEEDRIDEDLFAFLQSQSKLYQVVHQEDLVHDEENLQTPYSEVDDMDEKRIPLSESEQEEHSRSEE